MGKQLVRAETKRRGETLEDLMSSLCGSSNALLLMTSEKLVWRLIESQGIEIERS